MAEYFTLAEIIPSVDIELKKKNLEPVQSKELPTLVSFVVQYPKRHNPYIYSSQSYSYGHDSAVKMITERLLIYRDSQRLLSEYQPKSVESVEPIESTESTKLLTEIDLLQKENEYLKKENEYFRFAVQHFLGIVRLDT